MPQSSHPIRRIAVLAIALSVLSGCRTQLPTSTAANRPATSAAQVEISISRCGGGWHPTTAGHQQLVLHNTDTRPGEVMLADARSGAVYSYLEPLAAGSTANLSVDLAAGSYRFRCAMEDEDVVDGPVVTLTGQSTAHSPAVLPVTQADLIGPTRQYEHYVSGQLPVLLRLVDRLRGDLAAGQLASARTDWLPAHLEYERLGAAYGAFGDADAEINGLPDGLADPAFTGFHRIEYGLWHSQPASTLLAETNALRESIASLEHTFAAAQLDPAEVAIRAHEITENAIQFELTGQTDFGSASNLATVAANLQGTATVLNVLRSLLRSRYPMLGQTDTALRHAEQVVASTQHAGHWPGLAALTTRQREMINASLGNLVELLAPVAEICEPRRSS